MTGSIAYMPPDHDTLMSEIDAVNAARAESVRALRAAQDEYTAADRLRKQAARTVLDVDTGYTHEQLADALGFKGRHGLLRLASETNPAGGYEFARPVLVELAELAERFDTAITNRRGLVRELRTAPRAERLTFDQMGEAMGLAGESVRYLMGDRRGRKR